ncbi:hypothetical protein FOBRF1_016556 [Fusarium oxysporum]
MAELALAVIPLGITVTSGLVKYLKTFNDHDDDLARLVRQAERFESTFQSLEGVLKRSQLNPELSISSSEASVCLRECQKALEELDTLQQKIFATTTSAAATTPHVRTKNKIKGRCKKLMYPLRRSDIEALQGALNGLSTTLTLALGMLHLDEEFLIRKILNEQMVEIQKNKIVSSNISTDIKELRQPISEIGSSLPVLQTSVDAIVPHFDQRFDQISYQISYQNVQMQAQIESLLEIAGPTRYQDRLRTNQQLSYSRSGGEGTHLAALVDLGVAPAFLVIHYLHDAIELRNINEARSRTILSAAQRKLQELFCSGRASPNDVTEDSLTLLHILGLLTYPWLRTLQRANSPFVRSTCEGLLNFLVAAGTSVTVRNRFGISALHIVISGTFVPAPIYGQLNAGNDVEDRSNLHISSPINRCELIDYYDQNQSVARIHYGPLGLAVIRNNLPEVERLISLHPHILKEWLAHPYQQAEDLTPQDYATRFGSYVEIYDRSLNLGHRIIMVRQATFAALDLKHTCLDRPGYSRWPGHPHQMYHLDPVTQLEPDDMEFEILNVDVEAMNQLEEVVVLFQDFVLTGRQTTMSSKSASFDIDHSAFNELSTLGIDDLYYQRILEFWQHIWTNSMQAALDTVAKRWDHKLDGLNDFVQIATCEETIQETRDNLEEGDDDDEIFNRFIQRIQDI